MYKYSKFLLLMSMCMLLGGCLPIAADRVAFSVKGEVIDIYEKPLHNCIFNFVESIDERGEVYTEMRHYIKGTRIESRFHKDGGMALDPIKVLSNTIAEIDCGQGYEVYRSPSLISYKTFSINLGKIVISPQVVDESITQWLVR